MKKILPFLLPFLLLTACNKPQPSDAPVAPQNNEAADTAPNAENTPAGDAKTETAPAEDSKADVQPIPFPKLDAQLQPDSIEKDEHGNDISITYFANADDPGTREKLETQLREAGFSQISNGDNYEKVNGDQVVLISMSEGEGELMINIFRTRDPQSRYAKADTRIPYPLEQGLAAEYGNQTTGDDGEMIYTFFNRSPEFLSNYEMRLLNEGFTKARDDEIPLYHKILSDSTELVVLILKLNERGTDMRILMNAVVPK